ncbi:hypothetical protein Btru_011964 [Bulinus truncatus]|nr:hypothetical protein Btru_011964 [Bulinus truncatus]
MNRYTVFMEIWLVVVIFIILIIKSTVFLETVIYLCRLRRTKTSYEIEYQELLTVEPTAFHVAHLADLDSQNSKTLSQQNIAGSDMKDHVQGRELASAPELEPFQLNTYSSKCHLIQNVMQPRLDERRLHEGRLDEQRLENQLSEQKKLETQTNMHSQFWIELDFCGDKYDYNGDDSKDDFINGHFYDTNIIQMPQ